MQVGQAHHTSQPSGSSDSPSPPYGSDPSRVRVTSFTSLRTTCRIPPMWREGAVDQGHSRLSKERDALHLVTNCQSDVRPTSPQSLAVRRGGSIRPHIGTASPTQSIPSMWLNADSPNKSSLGRSGSVKSTLSTASGFRKPYHRLLDATKRCSLHLPMLASKTGNCSSLALPWSSSPPGGSSKI